MKTLVVFYSRTGTTKKVGQILAEQLGADVEEIKDTVDRKGAMGYLRSGRDAMKKNLTKLEPVRYNASDYERVIVGTPIWGWNVSVPVRTYLSQWKGKFPLKIAFYCTMGGSGDQKAFSEMEKTIELKPLATLALKTLEVIKGDVSGKIEEFLNKLNQ